MALEVCTFLNMSTKRSCLHLGFSENSVTLAADTLLRNSNRDGRADQGPEFEVLGEEGYSGARCSCRC